MTNFVLLLGIIHDAVEFAEKEYAAKTGEEKKQAAKDFVKEQVNKMPCLDETSLDDVLVDAGIEAAVKFMNRFEKGAK